MDTASRPTASATERRFGWTAVAVTLLGGGTIAVAPFLAWLHIPLLGSEGAVEFHLTAFDIAARPTINHHVSPWALVACGVAICALAWLGRTWSRALIVALALSAFGFDVLVARSWKPSVELGFGQPASFAIGLSLVAAAVLAVLIGQHFDQRPRSRLQPARGAVQPGS